VIARSLRAAAPLIVSRADSVPGGGDSGVQPGLVTLARCPGTETAASARPSTSGRRSDRRAIAPIACWRRLRLQPAEDFKHHGPGGPGRVEDQYVPPDAAAVRQQHQDRTKSMITKLHDDRS
jgi:hypothetical protein